MRIDSNTRGHVLWYYFSISNNDKKRIKVNLCNMMKPKNLYSKVLIHLTKAEYATFCFLSEKASVAECKLGAGML